MGNYFLILYVHALLSTALCGLIWTIQIVQYPLFLRVPADGFATFHHSHTTRIGWLVGPAMLGELALALALAVWPGTLPAAASWAGLGLLGLIWASTAFLQVPAHRRLAAGFDRAACERLIATNWLRTVAWTLRAGLSLWFLALGS